MTWSSCQFLVFGQNWDMVNPVVVFHPYFFLPGKALLITVSLGILSIGNIRTEDMVRIKLPPFFNTLLNPLGNHYFQNKYPKLKLN